MKHERARKVITRGPVRVVGKFPSRKSKRSLHWESQLERDRMCLLEFDPDVISFREQPETFDLLVEGQRYAYTPDIEVITRDGVVIEEIKPASRLDQFEPLFAAMSEEMIKRGICFRVITDTVIRLEPRLFNVKYLLRFRHYGIPEPVLAWSDAFLEENPEPTFGLLQRELDEVCAPRWMAWTLLAHHIIETDMDAVINTASPIKKGRGSGSCLPLH